MSEDSSELENAATTSGATPKRIEPGDVSGQREAQIRQREADMLAMRTAGVSVTAIAEHYDVDHSTVSHILSRVLKRTVAQPAAELRELQLQQIDRVIRAWWTEALGIDGQKKSEKAATLVLNALDRKARLLGLERIVVEQISETPEERAQRLAEQMEAYLQGQRDATGQSTSGEDKASTLNGS